jgi:hypothetical protein
MAACHPTPAVQRLQLQDSTRIGYGTTINSMNTHNSQKTLQQSTTYPPHLLNWVYLAIAEQNPSQAADQVKLSVTIEEANRKKEIL